MALRTTRYTTGTGKSGSSINVVLTGLDSVFEGVKADLKDTAQEAVDKILARAIPYTPMDTGDLRNTGKATVAKTSKGYQAKVSFGGPAPSGNYVDYAVIVHNDLQPKRFSVPGTGPLYLSKAVQELFNEIKQLFIDR